MSDIDSQFARFEGILGRYLTPEERRLLMRWESFLNDNAAAAPAADEFAEREGPAEHEGRFKIAGVKDGFEVGFVCSTLMLRPVWLPTEDDVIAFLTQDPINLDDQRIRQALAAAHNQRPTQVAQNVQVSEPMLRSMGFQHL